jgi:DNA-binding response OmpR family regulator
MGVAARPLFFAVDDEPQAQHWYARMLRAYGDVVVAPSVAAARRQLAKRLEVCAALFDVYLPDGSGLDVLAEFRRIYPSTPAVVVTGHVKGDVVNAAYDLDAGVMSKPFNRDRMQHWVERVISNHRAPGLRTPEADALGERVDALKALFARRPCDARVRYQIGEIVAELKRHPAEYGASAVATAASAIGEALPSLYRHARVAQRWRAGEFEVLLSQPMADGRTLSWSHLVSLAGVSAGRLYDRIVQQTLSHSWTVRQLDAALDEAGIAVPVSLGDRAD